jgi:OmpA-OmpF porin, OOP family
MRVVNYLITVTAAAGTTAILAGCGAGAGTQSAQPLSAPAMPAVCTASGPVVFAVSGREDSPLPALSGMMQTAAARAVRTGSAIGIVDVDGRPALLAGSAFSDPDAGNAEALDSDRQDYLAEIAVAVSRVRARYPHVDVLQALEVAGRAIRAACRFGGTIYLEDSGLQETGALNFRQAGALAASPASAVAFLTRAHELPDLHGITVVLVGIGDTAPPQEPLSIAQRNNLIAIWSAVARAARAKEVVVDPTPRSGPAPASVPHVDTVAVTPQQPWNPADQSYVFPDTGPLGFLPNLAVFRAPDEADNALRRLASYLKANPSARIELTGTTAHWGSYRSCVALSLARANAVKAVLVQLGASARQIVTTGLGWKFPGYENDQGPDGTLRPGPAEHNRSVIVTVL